MTEQMQKQIVKYEGAEYSLWRECIGGAPLAKDLDVARWLGFSDLHKIRNLIGRHFESLGEVSATMAETSEKGGRPGNEYYLTREQVLYLAAKSETPRAVEVLKTMIAVFALAMDGKIGLGSERRPGEDMRQLDLLPLLTQIVGNQGELLTYLKRQGDGRGLRSRVRTPAPAPAPERLIEVDELLDHWRQKRWPKCPPTRTALQRRLQRGFNGGPKSLWYEMAELGRRNRRGRELRWRLSEVARLFRSP